MDALLLTPAYLLGSNTDCGGPVQHAAVLPWSDVQFGPQERLIVLAPFDADLESIGTAIYLE